MAKKSKKKKVFEGEYKLIHETRNPEIDKLVKLYKEDRYKARVVFMNGDHQLYQSDRLGVFTEKNGDFNLVYFKKTFGISKTNVMYSNEKRVCNISYKGGKFHKVIRVGSNTYVRQITLQNLTQEIPWETGKFVNVFLTKKFSWLRHMIDNNVLQDMAFNSIIDKKLFSLKKALAYQYQVPYPVAKMLHSNKSHSGLTKYVKTYLPYIKNIENFNADWLQNNTFILFYDSIKMGRVLNKQVNCSWSEKRLKSEHDKWSEEIADIVFTYDNREMNVGQAYKDFQVFSGYSLLTTTKEMAIEGKKQRHCVASYVSSVDNHGCGIYRVGDYTLEVKRKYVDGEYGLFKGQLKGFNNENAPQELHEKVNKKLQEFNENIGVHIENSELDDIFMPF